MLEPCAAPAMGWQALAGVCSPATVPCFTDLLSSTGIDLGVNGVSAVLSTDHSAGASLARVRQSREGKVGESGLASNSTSTSSSRKPKKGSPPSNPSKPRPYKSLAKDVTSGNGKVGNGASTSGSHAGINDSFPLRFQRYVSGQGGSSTTKNGSAHLGNSLNGASAQNGNGSSGPVRRDSNTKQMLPDSDEAAKSRDRVGNISASLSASTSSSRHCRRCKQATHPFREKLRLRSGMFRAQSALQSAALSNAARGQGGALMLR